MKLNKDDIVRIGEDETDLRYIVAGIDKIGRMWLTVDNDDDYGGYDADLIVQESTNEDEFHVCISDSRSKYGMLVNVRKENG